MHDLSDGQKLALFDLVAEQRNRAWERVAEVESRLAAVEGHIAKYEAAIRKVVDEDGSFYTYEAYGGFNYPTLYADDLLAMINKELES